MILCLCDLCDSMSDSLFMCVFRAVSQDVIEAVNLLAQGKRNYMCGEVGHAVNQLQEACRLLYEHVTFFSFFFCIYF